MEWEWIAHNTNGETVLDWYVRKLRTINTVPTTFLLSMFEIKAMLSTLKKNAIKVISFVIFNLANSY